MNIKFLVTSVILIVIIIAAFSFVLLQNDNNETQTSNVSKDPFLWRIEGGNPSYLYGSIHLGNKDILTLPDVVIEAVDDSDVLYWEVKLDAETQSRIAELSFLTGDEVLSDILPQDVINRLTHF